MNTVQVVASSTVISAVVGGVAGWFSPRGLARYQAKINYEARARQRLYEAVGPLRFQLLLASRDLERRVSLHRGGGEWNMHPGEYFARSFIYRLLRPLAISMLIERQTSYADFAVDDSVLDLVKFETAAYRMLTGNELFTYHTSLDWAAESQHVFRDNLRKAAGRLLHEDKGGTVVVMTGSEFDTSFPDPITEEALRPIANLFAHCSKSLTENPIFWVRVVGYAYVCQQFIERNGKHLGFSARTLALPELLEGISDAQVSAHLTDYPEAYAAVLRQSL